MNSALLVKTPTKTSTCTATKAFRASWAHCLCGGITESGAFQFVVPRVRLTWYAKQRHRGIFAPLGSAARQQLADGPSWSSRSGSRPGYISFDAKSRPSCGRLSAMTVFVGPATPDEPAWRHSSA